MLVLDLAAGPGRAWWRSAPRRSSGRRRWRRCSPPAPASAGGARAIFFAIAFVAVARGPDPALPSRRRPARVLRPHPGLPGLAKLAVQRLGPGAVARLPAAGRAGGDAIALAFAVALWPRAKDAGPGRRAGGGGADRRPARRDALVLLLRRLVPAAGARGPVRRRSAARASADPRLQPPQGRRADRDLVAGLQPDAGARGSLPTPAGVPVETTSPGSRVISAREVRDQLPAPRRSGRRWRPPASRSPFRVSEKEIAVVRARPRRASPGPGRRAPSRRTPCPASTAGSRTEGRGPRGR